MSLASYQLLHPAIIYRCRVAVSYVANNMTYSSVQNAVVERLFLLFWNFSIRVFFLNAILIQFISGKRDVYLLRFVGLPRYL